MSTERLMRFLPAALAVVVLAAVFLFILNPPRTPSSSISLRGELASAACNGSVTLWAELRDESDKRVPEALVEFSAGQVQLDSLYTDRNGMVRAEFPLNSSWCGRRIDFSARFKGDGTLSGSSDVLPLVIRGPTTLELTVPEESETGQVVLANARLTNAISGDPMPGKPVRIGNISAQTSLNGTAVFELNFTGSGTADVSAEFAGDGFFEPSSDAGSMRIINPMCKDGTVVGQCSGQQLCTEERELVFDCGKCGCPGAMTCMDNKCLTDEERLQKLIEKLQRSNVKIQSNEGIGSGVIIGRNGSSLLILTNRHVADADFSFVSNTNLEILNFDNETAKPVRIYIAPNQLDMAIIVVNKDIGNPADIDYDLKPSIGSEVLVIGTPLGIPNSVTTGIISNYVLTNTSSGFDYEVIQTDAAVNPGNSGGGVYLSSSGKLAGIISFKLVIPGRGAGQLAEGLGFAIPVNIIKDYPLEEWKAIPPN